MAAASDDPSDDPDSVSHPARRRRLPPPARMPTLARQATIYALHGEWGRAWKTYEPSPVADLHAERTLQAALDLHPQRPAPSLARLDANGVAPVEISPEIFAANVLHLPALRAPGTLPSGNWIISAVARNGGARSMRTWGNAILADDVHASVKPLLIDMRLGMLEKRDVLTGEFKGYRPLGMGEKDRCWILSCVNAILKPSLNRYMTEPLPEDVRRHDELSDRAATRFLDAQMALDAAVGDASGPVVTAARAALHVARAAVAAAATPFKWVTNWAYSSSGVDCLARSLHAFMHARPTAKSDQQCCRPMLPYE